MSARDKIKYIPKDGQHQERAPERRRAGDDKMLPLSLLRLIRAQREIWTGAEIREKVGECCITSFLADVSHKLDDPGRILITF